MATYTASLYTDLLRLHGLKATPQRVAVLKLLAQSKEPQSISELQALPAGKRLDTVTLYRSLETLERASLVRQVDLRHGHADYELAAGRKHHHHLVCESCGKIEEFDWCPDHRLEKQLLAKAKGFATLTDHSLEFFGLCKKCAKRPNKITR